MGLDLVELAMELEKHFGIKFSNDEYYPAFCDTAGTLCEFVWQKLQGISPGVADFRRLHKELHTHFMSAPGRPWWYRGMNLKRLMSKGDLSENWRWLEQSLGISLPALLRDPSTNRLQIPPECASMSRLMYWIVENHPKRVSWLRSSSAAGRTVEAARFTHEDCWLGVRDAIAEIINIKAEQVTSDSHLIEELRMG
jgi:acyl carrier protein